MLGHHGETLVFLGFFFSFLWFVLVFGASSYFIRCVFLSFCFEKRKEVFSFFFFGPITLSFFLSFSSPSFPPTIPAVVIVCCCIYCSTQKKRERGRKVLLCEFCCVIRGMRCGRKLGMTVFPLPFSLFLPIPRPNCSCEGMGKETMRSIFLERN